jgi:ParB-like chromosome segregation protein Spo0J
VPIVCDEDLRILAGHTRRKAALKLGLRRVPVIVVAMDKRRQAAFSVADNQTATIAQWDNAGLSSILEKMKEQQVDLDSLGFSRAQLDALLAPCSVFPWDIFDKEMAAEPEKPYGLLPVKLPRSKLERVNKAIGAFAIRRGIRGKDRAMVAGKVLMAALGMRAE